MGTAPRTAILAVALALASSAWADGPVNYQIVQAEDGQIWRLDTRTGEILMCRAESGRMVCASSDGPSSTSADDLEVARERATHAREEAKAVRLERIVGLFERLIELVQKEQTAQMR